MSSLTTTRTVPNGLFITLEGIDGAGKSSHIAPLAALLTELGFAVLTVAEPGGTDYGRAARALFLEHHQSLSPAAEVGLLITAKAQLLHEKIFPALEAGTIVLCDRYTDTLYAYQHYAKGYDDELIARMLWAAGCDRNPDHTLYFKVSAETSMLRNHKRRVGDGDFNSFDAEGLVFRNRLIHGFESRLKARSIEGKGYTILDGELPQHTVFEKAQAAIMGILANRERKLLHPA